MKLWKARVQKVYKNLEEPKQYNRIYHVAKRCGYRSVEKLWAENPILQGSVNPKDFGLANKKPASR